MTFTEGYRGKNDLSPKEKTLRIFDVPVLLLVGGKGTRVQTVTNDEIPKPLIKITEDHAIIDLICNNLIRLGYRNFIFCLGHHSEELETHLISRPWKEIGLRLFFSKEESQGLLGVAGAAYKTIDKMKLSGSVFLLPGDVFLPWQNLEEMTRLHIYNSADITFGVTSVVTERTQDVGKILVARDSNRLIRCYPRNEVVPQVLADGLVSLTSAGVILVDAQKFSDMYVSYLNEMGLPKNTLLSIRDDILQWALTKAQYQIFAFDVGGEALDIGTEDRVLYARENWRKYMGYQ